MIITVFIFIFGLMVGSFLNVLIGRIPLQQDFIWTRSHCPKCNAQIPFYYNIPILSYMMLRGRCRSCKEPISWQYPLVELATGIYFVLVFPAIFTPFALIRWVLICSIFSILLVHLVIDLKYHILPDGLTISLFFIATLYSFLFLNWKLSLWGAGIGFIAPYLLSIAFYYLRGVEGLGGGDIKLWAVLGIILGPLGIIQNFFLSSLAGSIIGGMTILLLRKDRNFALAFGPYIIIAYLIQFHFAKFIPRFLQLF